MRRITSIVTLMSALVACGQVEPVTLTVSMPDCTYRGPSEMEPGEASLSLTLNGLGSVQALLVELEDDHTYDDLTAHLDRGDGWDDGPDWLRPVIELELSDTEGIDGTADNSRLGEGRYAVVCVDLGTGTARAASPFRVEESVSELDDGRGGDGGRGP